MPEPCIFVFFDSCQKKFLWTHKRIDLALRPVVGLVLQVGDVEKIPQAFGFEGLDPLLRVSKEGPHFTAIQEDGGNKRPVELMVLHHQILFSLAIVAIAEAVLMQTPAEQVPFLHRVAPRYLKLITSGRSC